MAIEPGVWNTKIYQGSKWEPTITFTGLDLTAGTWRMQIRERQNSSDIVATVTVTSALVGSDTEVYPVLTAIQTAALSYDDGFYDLEYVPVSGEADTVRYLQGKIPLNREVTR